jgi:sterol desaturase/sphingolipid hydroxylase (fatty acid hydroxylase superfamily)
MTLEKKMSCRYSLAMRESPSSPRMFQNDILDLFSRSPWWSAPVIWVPVAMMLFWHGRGIADAPFLPLAWGIALSGLFAWTLSEYVLHRFVFHWIGNSYVAKQIHFYIHGVHHQWPSDRFRLVMPPAASALLAIPFGLFFYSLLGRPAFFPFFSGYLIGYVMYECTHYAVHHLKLNHPWFKKLKRHHLQHHFSEHHKERHFGVSSPIWDIFFKTR